MRARLATLAGGLCLALVAGASPAIGGETSCNSFGTTLEFVDTPKEAARLAKKEEKLVFVLHVSGHFEDPRFT
jgi:hypothetical protein